MGSVVNDLVTVGTLGIFNPDEDLGFADKRRAEQKLKEQQKQAKAKQDKAIADQKEVSSFKSNRTALMSQIAKANSTKQQQSTLLTGDLGAANIRKKTLLGG